jgi:hypothetical protein
MPTVEKYLLGGTITTLITGGSALGNNALAIGSAFDNTVGQTGDGYTLGDVEFSGTFSVAPAANTGIAVWFLRSQNGTNYEDGDGTVGGSADTTPARNPDVVIPVRAVTSAQLVSRSVVLPWGKWKPLAKNDGTGQSLGSGFTLKVRPVTREGV